MTRDDAAKFIKVYMDKKIFTEDPFQTLDQKGIGKLIDIAIKGGRKTKKDLKVGVCGEHGGDPNSVKFCHRENFSYVSASPFRIPIARLAAAQAVIEGKMAGKGYSNK